MYALAPLAMADCSLWANWMLHPSETDTTIISRARLLCPFYSWMLCLSHLNSSHVAGFFVYCHHLWLHSCLDQRGRGKHSLSCSAYIEVIWFLPTGEARLNSPINPAMLHCLDHGRAQANAVLALWYLYRSPPYAVCPTLSTWPRKRMRHSTGRRMDQWVLNRLHAHNEASLFTFLPDYYCTTAMCPISLSSEQALGYSILALLAFIFLLSNRALYLLFIVEMIVHSCSCCASTDSKLLVIVAC